jgi:predicted Zn-dependent protease
MEADQLGIQYLWNTGYDPNAFVSLLEKMQVREKSNPGRSAAFFRTHPSIADRIAQCQEEQRALPKKDLYITSSPEFDRVKARLLANR